MNRDQNGQIVDNYFLEPGYILTTSKPTVISTVLGTSVSVCIYDRKRKVGGMNHFQLPYVSRKHQATARYGNVAAITLIRMMVRGGSKIKNLEAQILGGAHSREDSGENIGRKNISIARRVLARERIPVVSEDIGGEKGRKIVFDTGTNETVVMKVKKLRAGDWFPYKNNRADGLSH